MGAAAGDLEAVPEINQLINEGIEIERNMSAMITRLSRDFNRIRNPLSKRQWEYLTAVMFYGDAAQRKFSDDELTKLKMTPKLKKGYHALHKFFEKLGRYVESHDRKMSLTLVKRKSTLIRKLARMQGTPLENSAAHTTSGPTTWTA